MALGRASRQRSGSQGVAARQTYSSGVNPPVLGGANGQTGSLGTSFASARFTIGGSMFIPTQSSTSQSETTVFTTSATGQTGSLGQTFFSTDTLKHAEATGQTGSLGSSDTLTHIFTSAVGQSGFLGFSDTSSAIETESFMNSVVEYDSEGRPITLRYALQICLAVLSGKSTGFPGGGPKKFKSIKGDKDRVAGDSDADGNRENNPTFDFTDIP